jgi:hypothetical protein
LTWFWENPFLVFMFANLQYFFSYNSHKLSRRAKFGGVEKKVAFVVNLQMHCLNLESSVVALGLNSAHQPLIQWELNNDQQHKRDWAERLVAMTVENGRNRAGADCKRKPAPSILPPCPLTLVTKSFLIRLLPKYNYRNESCSICTNDTFEPQKQEILNVGPFLTQIHKIEPFTTICLTRNCPKNSIWSLFFNLFREAFWESGYSNYQHKSHTRTDIFLQIFELNILKVSWADLMDRNRRSRKREEHWPLARPLPSPWWRCVFRLLKWTRAEF